MKSLKTTFILFLFVFVNATAQQTTLKDSIKTTELDEVVVGIKKKAINMAREPIFPKSSAATMFINISILKILSNCCPNLSMKLQKSDRLVLFINDGAGIVALMLHVITAKLDNFFILLI